MRFDILTIFPEVFPAYLGASILGRAREKSLIETGVHDIRDFAEDKHKTVDDTPYGGGPGMILKVEPIDQALESINDKFQNPNAKSMTKFKGQRSKVVVLSARGEQFTQTKAAEYAELDQLVLICGRYEGIDQRVVDHLADEELSIGPYVLAGGEIAALAVMEATARLVQGVLGNPESLHEESHSTHYSLPTTHSLEHPQYTKPEEYRGWKVPDVLLSGNHAEIEKWRAARRSGSVDKS